MHTANCLNCGNPIEKGQKHCPRCGQSTHIHRLTFKHLFHEFFHAITHADKGILHLLKDLATRPGAMARDYIAGKRKSYFNPFSFFLIVMGVFVISSVIFKAAPERIPITPQMTAYIPTEEGKKKFIAFMNRVSDTKVFYGKYSNVVGGTAVFLISFFTWLFFKRRGYNYAEHLTANLFFVTFSNLIFAFIIYPLMGAFEFKSIPWILPMIGLVLQTIYLTWCLIGLFQLKSWGLVKGILVSLLAIIFWIAFSLTTQAVYIYQNWDFYKFFERMTNG